MSEGALDLSISSYEVNAQRHPARGHDLVSSDSGRASSESNTSSDIHEDIKPRFKSSPPPRMPASPSSGALPPPPSSSSGVPISSDPSSYRNNDSTNTHHSLGPSRSPKSPVPFSSSSSSAHIRNLPPSHAPLQHQQQQQPTAQSPLQHPHTTFNRTRSVSPKTPMAGDSGRLSNPNSPEASASSSLQDDDLKSHPLSFQSERGASDPRVAPIRPFKMYPVDAFNVYSSQLLPGSGSGIPPSTVGMQSLYDSASPSNFSPFPLTPLTSHLLQRKRRAELRDTANNPGSVKNERGSPVTSINSSSPILGSSGVSTTIMGIEPSLKRGSGSTSSDGQENETEAEKRAKLMPDEKKDDAYWDRRRKNNEAAKRSRDARRQKEEEIAMRAAFLEQENLKLRAQVAILKNETAKLHYMLYNRM